MIYLLGWLLIYFSILASSVSKYHGRFFGLMIIFYFATVSIFRGSVGTDTATYEVLILQFSLETLSTGIEPLFVLFSIFLREITGSPEIALRSISALFFLLMLYYFIRADKNERFVLIAYLAPAYFYQYSMNAVRIGLASVLLMIALQQIRRIGLYKSGFFSLNALFLHYSVFVSFIYYFSVLSNILKFKYLSIIAVVTTLIFFLYHSYFLNKINAYTLMEAPTELSGSSKIIVILVLVVGATFSNLSSKQLLKFISITLIFTFLALVLTFLSYAGLRILDLIAFAIAFILIMLHYQVNKEFNWQTKLSFFIAGLISAAAVYRGFLLEAGQGKSPFIPYHFMNSIV